MIGKEIQDQGLRTYLFSYGQYYDSLSNDELSSMFELSKNEVHAIVSKMIINEELHASWDQPTGVLIIHSQDPTPLQTLALNYAEKISVLSETSENTEQRNYSDRRGAWGQTAQKSKDPASIYGSGTTLIPLSGSARTERRPTTRTGLPANAFKKGKARPATDLGASGSGFRQRNPMK